jgi:ABC-type bacteriocin/lantibiotic exporter with double-glycine peptidase domain
MSEIPSTDGAQHPIRIAQRRIAEVFARGAALPRSKITPGLLSCVVPIAEAVGWRGTPRQIAEAMPHETPITDVGMFRTVLLRLGIETEKVNVPAHRIRNEYCPCIAVNGRNSLVFIQSVDTNGTARIFDSRTADWQTVSRARLVGEVYILRLLDPFLQQERLQRDGFVWPLLRRFSDSLKMVFWQSLAINLLGLAVSFYVMYVYDKAIGGKSIDTLTLLFIGGLAAVGMELRLRHLRAAAIARLGARFDALAVTGAFRTVLGLPLGMSENAPLSAQLTRFRQMEVGRELFGGSLATSLIDLPFTIIFFVMIFALGGTLGFVPVAFAAILSIVGLCTTPGLSKQIREMGDWKAKSDALLIEICTRLKLIRADNAEDVWLQRTSESYRNYLISKFQSQQYNNTLQVLAQAGVTISGAAVLWLGTLEVMEGKLSIGALIAVMAVVWRVLGPIQTVFLSMHRIKTIIGTIRQLDRLIKIKPEREHGRITGAGLTLSGQMSLEGICFRYANRSDLTIKGISLNIKAGEFITVAGPSGAGKSTLLKIMLGLYQSQSGSVRVDDLDLRQIDPTELRQRLRFLGQEPAFFYGTVAQNLRLAAADSTDAELVGALESVGISVTNPILLEGLDTRFNAVSRRAMSLSFIQRLAVARAFLGEAPIILLDEPANHLDREGDEALLRLIAKARGRSTIIMTTARPSHMRAADRVIVLQDGIVAAQGKPEQIVPLLMTQNARAAG